MTGLSCSSSTTTHRNAKLARDVLELAGIRDAVGRELLARRQISGAGEHRPDLVLMDLRPPRSRRRRGGQAARRGRALGPGSPWSR